jgi:CRISPR-associated endoribonuclease Cas6
MRFKIIFYGQPIDLLSQNKNVDIRRDFISFLKKSFEKVSKEKYNSLFSTKRLKPYVYAAFLGTELSHGKIGPQISFIFSSGDHEIISLFWNGILQLKKEREDKIILSGQKFIMKDIELLPEKKINSTKVLFRTIGISVVTNPHASPKDFKKWYVIPEKGNIEEFNKILNERIRQKYKIIKNKDMRSEIKFSLYERNGNTLIKETIVSAFNGYIRGFRGCFFLEGEPEILKFLYDYGFGVRTGQGFGLLDVVKQA